jgi:hypothetical protein
MSQYGLPNGGLRTCDELRDSVAALNLPHQQMAKKIPPTTKQTTTSPAPQPSPHLYRKLRTSQTCLTYSTSSSRRAETRNRSKSRRGGDMRQRRLWTKLSRCMKITARVNAPHESTRLEDHTLIHINSSVLSDPSEHEDQ